ncbi:MAG: hypothetical protein ABIJ97_05760 [Bacteroidota bacterium]
MKWVYLALGIVAVIASILMYRVGSTSSHLSELMSYYLYPLPLAIIGIIGFFTKKSNKTGTN